MTGKRQLIEMLSWDFCDFKAGHTPKTNTRKGWSSRLRKKEKNELRKELALAD